jgi:serine/threonine protein kinase
VQKGLVCGALTIHSSQMHGASADCTVIVLEEALTDLYYLLKKQKQPIKLDMVIRWSRDILEGVDFLHRRKIVHRDLKSGNILVFPNRVVKICDFGLARGDISEEMDIHREIVTLWYRAPELLMGIKHYGPRVDEWSVGCIILEMLCGMCIIPGNNKDVCDCQKSTHINFNSDQLVKVLKLVGTPTDEKLLSKMHCWEHFKNWPVYPARLGRVVENMCTEDRSAANDPNPADTAQEISKNMYDVLQTLLDPDPWKRATAREAVSMKLFERVEAPRPAVTKERDSDEDGDRKAQAATVHKGSGEAPTADKKIDVEPRTRHTSHR